VIAKTPLKKTVAKIALASLRYEMQNGFFFHFVFASPWVGNLPVA